MSIVLDLTECVLRCSLKIQYIQCVGGGSNLSTFKFIQDLYDYGDLNSKFTEIHFSIGHYLRIHHPEYY